MAWRIYTHSHGSEPIHENGKRERAPAPMRGIADRDESRSAGLSLTRCGVRPVSGRSRRVQPLLEARNVGRQMLNMRVIGDRKLSRQAPFRDHIGAVGNLE